MAFAADVAFFVDLVAAVADHFCFHGHIAGGQSDAIELQLQVTLAEEMAGFLVGFKMSNQVGATREGLMTEFGHAAKMTENRVPYRSSRRIEVRFINGALQNRAGGQDNF